MSVVIACNHCGTKYKVDPAKFSSPNPRIRCKKCSEVFTAQLGQPESQTAEPVAAPAPAPTAPANPDSAQQTAAPSASATGDSNEIAVLFAHESDEVRATVDNVGMEAGFRYRSVANGVDALVEIQSGQYDVAVLDVALPRMFGFEVCEVVRRDHNLDKTKLILIAAIYDQQRYRRPPSSLYGADGYIEKQDLDIRFAEKIREIHASSAGSSDQSNPETEASTPSASTPAQVPASAAQPQAVEPNNVPADPPVSAPAPAPEPTSVAEQAPTSSSVPTSATAENTDVPEGIEKRDLEKARRLGRVIVSDLALYNGDVFKTANTPDDIYNALQKDIADSRAQIEIKVSEAIREFEDVLDIAVRAYLEKHRS